ncbi:MAG TPA: hypothetical protein VEG64_14330 [Candidatus Sulfotelmatobacter sp.]|nr:hypothetical protein [Candidatus Sulfotelmatobacter sp.]
MYSKGSGQLRSFYSTFLRVMLWVLLGGAAGELVYRAAAIDH